MSANMDRRFSAGIVRSDESCFAVFDDHGGGNTFAHAGWEKLLGPQSAGGQFHRCGNDTVGGVAGGDGPIVGGVFADLPALESDV